MYIHAYVFSVGVCMCVCVVSVHMYMYIHNFPLFSLSLSLSLYIFINYPPVSIGPPNRGGAVTARRTTLGAKNKIQASGTRA